MEQYVLFIPRFTLYLTPFPALSKRVMLKGYKGGRLVALVLKLKSFNNIKNLIMKTSDFLTTAEKDGPNYIIFRSQQSRWNSDQMADPMVCDIEYHLTADEAKSAAESISLDIGFIPQVDALKIPIDRVMQGNEYVFLEDLADEAQDVETLWSGDEHHGDALPESGYIVFYKHHRYMNYAHDIVRVEPVKMTGLTHESDMRNDSDSTSAIYCECYSDLDELQEAYENGDGIFSKIHSGGRYVEALIYAESE